MYIRHWLLPFLMCFTMNHIYVHVYIYVGAWRHKWRLQVQSWREEMPRPLQKLSLMSVVWTVLSLIIYTTLFSEWVSFVFL